MRSSLLSDTLVLASVLSLAHTLPLSAKPPQRPNVLLILTDDQRWDAMSCAGHPLLKTPNMDRLAAEGARFANMFVTTSLCSPSRASFLSGLYAHRHGVAQQLHRIPRLSPELPQAPARGGLRDGLLRQVAHGRDQRQPAHRLRLLDEPPRPGQLLRQRVEHQRRRPSSSKATTRRSSPNTPSNG